MNNFFLTEISYVSVGGHTTTKKMKLTIKDKLGMSKILFIIFTIFFDFFLFAFSKNGFKSLQFLLCTLTLFILDSIFIVLSNKLRSKYEYKNKEKKLYERETYDDLQPAHIRMIVENGKIDAVSITATFINLIDKGILGIKRKDNTNENNALNFFDKSNNIIIFKKNLNKKIDPIEQYIITWFIEELGNGQEVSTEQINCGLKKYYRPADKFIEWQELIINSFPTDEYLSKGKSKPQIKKIKTFSLMLLFLSTFFVTFDVYFVENTIFSTQQIVFMIYSLSLISGLLLLFNPPVVVYSQKGVDTFTKYIALKNYIMDFSDMKNKEPEAVLVWSKYLVYAVLFDIAKEVKEDLENFYGEEIYFTDECFDYE